MPVGQVGNVEGFGGGVVADEPRAAVIGRDTLSAGGNAVDAAVAIYFALSVTYPSAASLGGGGYCIYHNPNRANAVPQVLEFPLVAPAGGGAVAVPSVVRGMGILHTRYGKLRWEQLVTPGEQLARRGFQSTRAHLKSMEEHADLAAEADLAPLFTDTEGKARVEGQAVFQHDLATTLAQIRANGAGEIYHGALSHMLVAASAQRGGSLTADDLRIIQARWAGPLAVALPNKLAAFMPSTQNAKVAATLWTWLGAGPADFNRIAQMSGTAYNLPREPAKLNSTGSTTFTAVDRQGLAVACAVTLGKPFGTHKIAPGTGIVLAAVPGIPNDETPTLLPVIVASTERGDYQVHLAGGAAGGETSAAAMVETLRAFLLDRKIGPAAVAMPRLFRAAPNAQILYEAGYPGANPGAGREVPALGRVNVITCPGGLNTTPSSCNFVADKRGHGLGDGGLM